VSTVGELLAESPLLARRRACCWPWSSKCGRNADRPPERAVDDAAAARFATLAARARRRTRRLPARLEGVLWAPLRRFAGRAGARPETELLVELALARLRTRPQARVLDLGTAPAASPSPWRSSVRKRRW